MPLLRCEHVCLSYDGLRDAVSDLTLAVEPGSIFALVGPNGAGKTSTLRMLATLQPPTSGTLVVDGIDLQRDPESARRRIGYLPDHFALYDQQTPVEYLEFFARLHGVPSKGRRARIDALLEELDLSEKRTSPIRTLSRGMRQRLGLAKTLVHEPKLLLLDEPASALDPGARIKLRDALLRLRRREVAVIISSHILPDLAGLADSVGIMEGGRLISSGAIEDVAGKARGAEVVLLVVVGHPDRARRVFGDFGARVVAVEEAAPGRFHVTVNAPPADGGRALEELVADLADALVLRGARLSHLAPRESALEAVYRASAASAVA